jgi:hypothetical protein
MRGFGHFPLIGTLAAVSLRAVSTPSSQAPARDATAILAQAREALGGEKRLSAVKSFVATGRTRQVRGDNLVPIEFEIAVELPDKYVRKDEIPAQESGPTSTGFNGSDLIQLPVPVAPTPPAGPAREGGPPAPNPAQLEAMRAAEVAHRQAGLRRLDARNVCGLVRSVSARRLPTWVSRGAAGKADVIEARRTQLYGRLFVNSEVHLPVMVSWRRQPGRGGRAAEGRAVQGPAPGPPGRSGGTRRTGRRTPPVARRGARSGAAQPPCRASGEWGATRLLPAPAAGGARRRGARPPGAVTAGWRAGGWS